VFDRFFQADRLGFDLASQEAAFDFDSHFTPLD
jgi:hypothetical protein